MQISFYRCADLDCRVLGTIKDARDTATGKKDLSKLQAERR